LNDSAKFATMEDLEKAFKKWGIDYTGRNPNHARGGVLSSLSMLFFVFYVMMGGNPAFVVLAGSLPIIKHTSSKTSLADAALEALLAMGLVRPGTGNPTVIHTIIGLSDRHPVIHFVQVDEAALVPPGHSLFGSKVYSFVDPRTGKTRGGKYATIPGFGATQYTEMLTALLPNLSSVPPPSLAEYARGGSGAVAGGGGAAGAVSHHHRGKTHLDPECGHKVCNELRSINAGPDAIVLPVFEYHCKDGIKKSVVIMGFDDGSWNFFCVKMEDSDYRCWIWTIPRELKKEGKILLSRYLNDYDIKLGNPISRTPVFYVKLERSMVIHDLSRVVLNAQIAAENRDPSPPICNKNIQAIGFFERVGNNLVPLPGNPFGYPNTFSPVVRSWLSS
jgi:hypothetical protein